MYNMMISKYEPKVKSGEKKQNAKYIKGRTTTFTYEISKTLSDVDKEIFTEEDKELKEQLLNLNGFCEYCEKYSATTHDHYRSLVRDSHPTYYCNDEWNMIPCCKDCNSSKGSNDIFTWMSGQSVKNPFKNLSQEEKHKALLKWKAYDKAFEDRHYTKEFPDKDVRELKIKYCAMLQEIQDIADDLRSRTIYKRKGIEIVSAKDNSNISDHPLLRYVENTLLDP